MLESRSPSSSGPVTRSLFSLKPPPLPRAANGGAGAGAANGPGAPAAPASPGPGAALPANAPLEDLVLTKLRGAAQALPPTVAPTSVRAIRPGELVRALSEALAPERRRFEEELARGRQRALELEAELERIQAERRDVDETRRVELPRLAGLVDQERTRAEELEREREAFAARVAELERELERREAQARALESALPPADSADGGDVLARVQQRLEALSAAPSAATSTATSTGPGGEEPARGVRPTTDTPDTSTMGPATETPGRVEGEGDALVQALLSSDARALRIAALEQRVAALTGEAAELPGADQPPAARAVLALLRASQEQAQARAERVEARVAELLEVTRDLHGALIEERRRRTLVEGALRAAQARLAVVEQREPAAVRLPSFASVIKGDVGPLLDALRDEARRRDESLEGKVQRLSLATRAALERMAEILDQALVAGLFDRDMPRLDPEALSAPLLEALGAASPARQAPDRWREALDALDAEMIDDVDAEEEVEDDLAERDADEGDEGDEGPPLDTAPTLVATSDDDQAAEASDGTDQQRTRAVSPLFTGSARREPHRSIADDDDPGEGPPLHDDPHGPDLGAWGDAPAGGVAPSSARPPADSDDGTGFVEHLEDEADEVATQEELAAWFHPGRPGQSEAEREAEHLARFDLVPPPAPEAAPDPVAARPAPEEQDLGELEGLDAAQADALRDTASLDAERRRLEERVRDAERALESEVWRGLATHRELVSTRQRLEELEARLAGDGTSPGSEPDTTAAAAEEPAPTLGGLEPIADVEPLRREASIEATAERAAVLSLDVEDRDTWVHWLLLEQDPAYQARRARAVRDCAQAMRSSQPAPDVELGRDELLHWLESDPPA